MYNKIEEKSKGGRQVWEEIDKKKPKLAMHEFVDLLTDNNRFTNADHYDKDENEDDGWLSHGKGGRRDNDERKAPHEQEDALEKLKGSRSDERSESERVP